MGLIMRIANTERINKMDKNDKLPTQIIAEEVSAFMQVLQSGEDIETGIGVYRDIAFSVKQLEDVKTVAKSLVESVMRETGESKIVCQSGTACFFLPDGVLYIR